jgi:hypothetical protein
MADKKKKQGRPKKEIEKKEIEKKTDDKTKKKDLDDDLDF